MPSSRKALTVDYKQLHSFSSVVFMTQQLARYIEGDFMMWKELLLGENVAR